MPAKLIKKLIDNKDFPQYEAIKGLVFYVKDYQRSYKWEEKQVVALLEDLLGFIKRPVSVGTPIDKYCLQPLVVKKYDNGFGYSHQLGAETSNQKQIFDADQVAWEVIDGQQRLTTLWLILHACQTQLNQPEPMPFDIYYEQFRAMDEYYIDKANDVIIKWMQNPDRNYDDISDIRKCIRQFVMLIWYEVDKSTNSVDVFTRLNIGKIPLTDAELFKAMLLSPKSAEKDKLDVIAYEWDNIEQQLRNEDFWYFISNTDMVEETRIDFLLRLYAVDLCGQKLVTKNVNENAELFSFLAISEYLENNKEVSAINIWEEGIVKIFEMLKWWYSDHVLYHKLGFIIKETAEKNKYNRIKELVSQAKKLTKSEFHIYVQAAIKEIFGKVLKKGKQFSELDYELDSEGIEKVLLYFNLITMMNSKSKQRFSFRNYKIEREEKTDDGKKVKIKWQLEHIHAQKTDEQIKTMKSSARKELLEGMKRELEAIADKNAKQAIKKIDAKLEDGTYAEDKTSSDDFYKFYKDIATTYGEVDMHGIGNLTLLDSATNESYHNDLFPNKRKIILERDRTGTFIPICTHNVFLKAYSQSMDNMMKWTKSDADAYAQAILTAFKESKIW